jgi:outer membrane protein OmpA-like peptidoglycan-associated protein
MGLARRATAQSTSIYIERAELSGRPYDGFVLFRPYMPERTRFYGSLAVGYTLNPLRAESVTDGVTATQIDNLIKHRFTTYATFGLALARRLSLNLQLPVVAYQSAGDDPRSFQVGAGGIADNKTVASDVRMDARLLALESSTGGTKLGLGSAVFIGTGSDLGFVSDDAVSYFVFANTEIDVGGAIIVGHVGPHFRADRSIGGTAGTLRTGNEIRGAFGALVPMRDDMVRLGASMFGSFGFNEGASATNNLDIEWLGEARFALNDTRTLFLHGGGGTRLSLGYGAPDLRLLVSLSAQFGVDDEAPVQKPSGYKGPRRADDYAKDRDKDGYPDDIDNCPTIKEDGLEPNPSDGCPRPSDRDKDGIFDADDKCPDEPEDADGFQDGDGCPEDNDNDGIIDVEDACPDKPGPPNKDPAKHGCPTLTVVEDGEVKLLKPIEFEYNKSTIRPVSYPILDEVVALMKARPGMRIAVHGHTDNRGGDQYNLKLSDGRAAAVMAYVVSKGIDASRLESQGFGASRPLESNATDQGRARNRRVEFKIVSEGGEDESGGSSGSPSESDDTEPETGTDQPAESDDE